MFNYLSCNFFFFLEFLLIYTGMNTGIQDSHNLAWKIASVVKGIAPPSILNTYETERRPVLALSSSLLHIILF